MLILVHGGCIEMHKTLAALVASLSLLSSTAIHAQALNACDLNGDGAVNILDVQLATNMVLWLAPCTANVIGAGVCNIVMIQRVVNAAVSGACVTGLPHSASLNWTASTSG